MIATLVLASDVNRIQLRAMIRKPSPAHALQDSSMTLMRNAFPNMLSPPSVATTSSMTETHFNARLVIIHVKHAMALKAVSVHHATTGCYTMLLIIRVAVMTDTTWKRHTLKMNL